jgi:hypothetical protein
MVIKREKYLRYINNAIIDCKSNIFTCALHQLPLSSNKLLHEFIVQD